jgi:hypothetical protein
VIIESTTGAGCGTCTILDAVLINASDRSISQSLNKRPGLLPGGGEPRYRRRRQLDRLFTCRLEPPLGGAAHVSDRLRPDLRSTRQNFGRCLRGS